MPASDRAPRRRAGRKQHAVAGQNFRVDDLLLGTAFFRVVGKGSYYAANDGR
jgi:hypothetical protein